MRMAVGIVVLVLVLVVLVVLLYGYYDDADRRRQPPSLSVRQRDEQRAPLIVRCICTCRLIVVLTDDCSTSAELYSILFTKQSEPCRRLLGSLQF